MHADIELRTCTVPIHTRMKINHEGRISVVWGLAALLELDMPILTNRQPFG